MGFEFSGARTRWGLLCAGVAVLGLVACSRSSSSQPQVEVTSLQAGATPFIAMLGLRGNELSAVQSIDYLIAAKPGAASRPVHVQYTIAALFRQARLRTLGFDRWGGNLPVYGLYAGYLNAVTVTVHYADGTVKALQVPVQTAAYVDPNGVYDVPLLKVARSAGSSLGFDYAMLKSNYGPPVIVDSDAAVRWVGSAAVPALPSTVSGDGFLVGDQGAPNLFILGLDGSVVEQPLSDPAYLYFHHNIDRGKTGFFGEVDTMTGTTTNIESNLIELDQSGKVLHHWDLAAIIADYMKSQGDDAAAFVRPGVDWFHMNASTYNAADDSIVVSSRENFLIDIDYQTGAINWILGDPTKYWYTFPSLRAKALLLDAGGLYPVGQHSVSILGDGAIMIFNDGFGSLHQPAGMPAGINRSYSAVSAYTVDPVAHTAHEAWEFDYSQSILSTVCSSAYQTADGSVLVDYAVADNFTHARLVGLDPAHNVVFDYQYSTTGCTTSWNAMPIALENFQIQ